MLLIQQYLPQIENVSLIDKINHKNELGYFDVTPSIKDLTCILGFKELKKISLNINKFYGILEWLQENGIPTSVKEIEVINGHAILEEVFIRAFERSSFFPRLEKLVIDPFDYYGRKCGKSLHSLLFYKKPCDFFSTRALLSHFLHFQNKSQFFPFFHEI